MENCRHVRGGAASRAALLVGHVVLPVWRDGHVHRRTPSAARTGRGRSGAGTQDAEPTPYQEAIPALVVRRGSICLQPRFEVRWFGPRGPAAQPRPITSESTRSPHRASALRRHVAGGVSGSPRAVGWRQGAAPGASFWSGGGDASGALQASCPPAFPPHHRPRGGASLSALSLPDPHPALARAGVILAAAAARRPPACHRPQPGADKPWRRRRRRRRRRHC